MAQYVIIGNGTAAASCIEGIRSVDTVSPITVVSAENHPVYCRPLISYYLEGRTDTERMKYRADSFYDDNGCTVLYGRKAAGIDPDSKTVTLDSGEKLGYTSLCVAAGSSPFVPPFEGLGNVKNRFSFMTLDDALSLEEAVTPESDVLIIGAGLIGLKCAEGIKNRVKSVTVCDLADRVLSSILDGECAAMVQKNLESNSINFMLSDTAVSFSENTAYMKSGRQVHFDILVTAVGVRANSGLVKDAGGETDRGIIVDCRMKTSLDCIYAAGDCTQGTDISFGAKRILALLPNANLQGRCAGINMAGGECVFDNAIPMNAIGFFGQHIMTAGTYFTADEGGEMYEEKQDGKIKRLFTKGNFLTGFILVDCSERAGIYTSLIREKIPLDTVNFDLLKKSATTAAFTAEKRGKMFGGMV